MALHTKQFCKSLLIDCSRISQSGRAAQSPTLPKEGQLVFFRGLWLEHVPNSLPAVSLQAGRAHAHYVLQAKSLRTQSQ